MKTLVILVALMGFVGMSSAAKGQQVKTDTTISGKIVKEQFAHGKAVEGVYDYFFQSGDKKYFIKTYKSKYSKDQLDKLVGQPIQVNVTVVPNGTWDDNGEGESRVGEYIMLQDLTTL
ncbi:MAG TPA: hypothetical protein VK890_12995 [Bacteroidia bacterium]|jgi:hypothetical protein|nr:hypothetical protein [Bacteroidia bacterium]